MSERDIIKYTNLVNDLYKRQCSKKDILTACINMSKGRLNPKDISDLVDKLEPNREV